MTAEETLIAARNYLVENGWGRKNYLELLDSDGPDALGISIRLSELDVEALYGRPACVLGAMAMARHENPFNASWPLVMLGDAALKDIIKTLLSVIVQPHTSGDTHCSIAGWNDDPNRTFEEVLEVLDKAIALVRTTSPEKELVPA